MRTPQPNLTKALDETVQAVRDRTDLVPRIGVVLGSELGEFADRLRNAVKLPYGSLPHVGRPATGDGDLFLGFIDDVPVACLQGRVRPGDGLPAWQVVHAARAIARLGVKVALVAEGAGMLEPSWTVGSLMVVTDHINLTFHDGLGRIADDTFEAFPNMRAAYDPLLRAELREVVRTEKMLSARVGTNTEIELVEGVYAGMRDPTYETPAQMRMLRSLGAHAVGVSTVLEVVALRQLGVRVAALSHLAYRVADSDEPAVDEETTSRFSLTEFQRLLRGWILRAHRTCT